MSQVMMHPLMLAVSFALNLGGAAFADTVQFTSLVSELNAVELSKLPLGHARTQDDNRWQCALVAEEISSAAGKVVVANNWRVTSEVERAGLTFVSFVANAEPGTSGSCMQSDGNVGIFRGESLLGIIYANNASKRTIGSIEPLEGDRLRIWDGDYLHLPLADLEIVGRDLVIVRNVADRDSFCDGTSSAPNIFGLPIHLAREVLFAEGWETGPVSPDDETDGMSVESRKRFPELDACSGTGFGFCAYMYSKEATQAMRVISANGPPEEMTNQVTSFSVQCGTDIQQ